MGDRNNNQNNPNSIANLLLKHKNNTHARKPEAKNPTNQVNPRNNQAQQHSNNQFSTFEQQKAQVRGRNREIQFLFLNHLSSYFGSVRATGSFKESGKKITSQAFVEAVKEHYGDIPVSVHVVGKKPKSAKTIAEHLSGLDDKIALITINQIFKGFNGGKAADSIGTTDNHKGKTNIQNRGADYSDFLQELSQNKSKGKKTHKDSTSQPPKDKALPSRKNINVATAHISVNTTTSIAPSTPNNKKARKHKTPSRTPFKAQPQVNLKSLKDLEIPSQGTTISFNVSQEGSRRDELQNLHDELNVRLKKNKIPPENAKKNFFNDKAIGGYENDVVGCSIRQLQKLIKIDLKYDYQETSIGGQRKMRNDVLYTGTEKKTPTASRISGHYIETDPTIESLKNITQRDNYSYKVMLEEVRSFVDKLEPVEKAIFGAAVTRCVDGGGTSAYKLSLLRLEFSLIKLQIDDFKDKNIASLPENAPRNRNGVPGFNAQIKYIKDYTRPSKVDELLRLKFNDQVAGDIETFRAAEINQISKGPDALSNAERNPVIKDFKSRILTAKAYKALFQGESQLLSADQFSKLEAFEEMIINVKDDGRSKRSKTNIIFDTGDGKTHLIHLFERYMDALKVPSNIIGHAGGKKVEVRVNSIESVDLANKERLQELKNACDRAEKKGKANALEGKLIIIDEMFFISQRFNENGIDIDLSQFIDNGAQVMISGASANKEKLLYNFNRVEDKSAEQHKKIEESRKAVQVKEGEFKKYKEFKKKIEKCCQILESGDAGYDEKHDTVKYLNTVALKKVIGEFEKSGLVDSNNPELFISDVKALDKKTIKHSTKTAIEQTDLIEGNKLREDFVKSEYVNIIRTVRSFFEEKELESRKEFQKLETARDKIEKDPKSKDYVRKLQTFKSEAGAVQSRRDNAKKEIASSKVALIPDGLKDNWVELVIKQHKEHHKDVGGKSQHMFPTLKLFDKEEDDRLKSTKNNLYKIFFEQDKSGNKVFQNVDLVVANYVEDKKHKCLILKTVKDEKGRYIKDEKGHNKVYPYEVFADDALNIKNKMLTLKSLTQGVDNAVMIYDEAFAVGGDYDELSVLTKGSSQNTYLDKGEYIDVDYIKQCYGRDRSKVSQAKKNILICKGAVNLQEMPEHTKLNAAKVADFAYKSAEIKDVSELTHHKNQKSGRDEFVKDKDWRQKSSKNKAEKGSSKVCKNWQAADGKVDKLTGATAGKMKASDLSAPSVPDNAPVHELDWDKLLKIQKVKPNPTSKPVSKNRNYQGLNVGKETKRGIPVFTINLDDILNKKTSDTNNPTESEVSEVISKGLALLDNEKEIREEKGKRSDNSKPAKEIADLTPQFTRLVSDPVVAASLAKECEKFRTIDKKYLGEAVEEYLGSVKKSETSNKSDYIPSDSDDEKNRYNFEGSGTPKLITANEADVVAEMRKVMLEYIDGNKIKNVSSKIRQAVTLVNEVTAFSELITQFRTVSANKVDTFVKNCQNHIGCEKDGLDEAVKGYWGNIQHKTPYKATSQKKAHYISGKETDETANRLHNSHVPDTPFSNNPSLVNSFTPTQRIATPESGVSTESANNGEKIVTPRSLLGTPGTEGENLSDAEVTPVKETPLRSALKKQANTPQGVTPEDKGTPKSTTGESINSSNQKVTPENSPGTSGIGDEILSDGDLTSNSSDAEVTPVKKTPLRSAIKKQDNTAQGDTSGAIGTPKSTIRKSSNSDKKVTPENLPGTSGIGGEVLSDGDLTSNSSDAEVTPVKKTPLKSALKKQVNTPQGVTPKDKGTPKSTTGESINSSNQKVTPENSPGTSGIGDEILSDGDLTSNSSDAEVTPVKKTPLKSALKKQVNTPQGVTPEDKGTLKSTTGESINSSNQTVTPENSPGTSGIGDGNFSDDEVITDSEALPVSETATAPQSEVNTPYTAGLKKNVHFPEDLVMPGIAEEDASSDNESHVEKKLFDDFASPKKNSSGEVSDSVSEEATPNQSNSAEKLEKRNGNIQAVKDFLIERVGEIDNGMDADSLAKVTKIITFKNDKKIEQNIRDVIYIINPKSNPKSVNEFLDVCGETSSDELTSRLTQSWKGIEAGYNLGEKAAAIFGDPFEEEKTYYRKNRKDIHHGKGLAHTEKDLGKACDREVEKEILDDRVRAMANSLKRIFEKMAKKDFKVGDLTIADSSILKNIANKPDVRSSIDKLESDMTQYNKAEGNLKSDDAKDNIFANLRDHFEAINYDKESSQSKKVEQENSNKDAFTMLKSLLEPAAIMTPQSRQQFLENHREIYK